MRVVIAGGGIGGLTAALMASRMGFKTTVLQSRERFDLHSFGGGIGLWPPSQMVMERLGLLSELQKEGLYMPDPYYLNSQGKVLGHPAQGFCNRYKILSLKRNILSSILFSACQNSGVQLLSNTNLLNFTLENDHVKLQLTNGRELLADNLIGADGINSFVRTKILEIRGQKKVEPHHCGYAYFRAVTDLSSHPELLASYYTTAFQSWGQNKRFGYVPLKSPKTFWFVAIPTGQKGLQRFVGSHTLTPESKEWLLAQFAHWKGKVDIKKLIQASDPQIILRTDIRKIGGVTKFSWATKDGKVILLGDAANATAPNIAQGAGLAIQSAWDMFSMVDFRNGNKGLEKYLQHRKKRAYTVQSIADIVAYVGQLNKPASTIRDILMSLPTKYLPSLQSKIFQSVVRYSTGGNNAQKHWLPFINTNQFFTKNIRQENCLLGSIVGAEEFNKLPQFVKDFRSSMIGSGKGTVSVRNVTLLGRILGLPPNMVDEPFGAYVNLSYENNCQPVQTWTRVFGEGTKNALKYETYHRAGVDFSAKNTGLRLTQSLGIGPDILRFGYDTKIEGNKIHYSTKNIWLRNTNINLPRWLLPISRWTEEINQKSWKFHGTISLPAIIGGKVMMQYQGLFQPELKIEAPSRKKVVIAGGSGMIGSMVCKQFYKNGWKVQVLSRNRINSMNELPFATVHQWNPDKGQTKQNMQVLRSCLNDADVVINLAGHNPGEGPWTQQIKQKILNSRLDSINVLYQGLQLCDSKQRTFVQASAAGIYGDRNDSIIDDTQLPSQQKSFRIECCKKIEEGIRSKIPEAIVTRFGHVFSSNDGLFPHLKIASFFGVKRLGSRDRYVPWVHVQDVAGAIYHCTENKGIYQGKEINIASPQHHTYSEVLTFLNNLKIASQLRRLCIPDIFLKTALGQMSSVLLQSQRMNPKILIENGYKFKFEQLDKALLSKQCL